MGKVKNPCITCGGRIDANRHSKYCSNTCRTMSSRTRKKEQASKIYGVLWANARKLTDTEEKAGVLVSNYLERHNLKAPEDDGTNFVKKLAAAVLNGAYDDLERLAKKTRWKCESVNYYTDDIVNKHSALSFLRGERFNIQTYQWESDSATHYVLSYWCACAGMDAEHVMRWAKEHV